MGGAHKTPGPSGNGQAQTMAGGARDLCATRGGSGGACATGHTVRGGGRTFPLVGTATGDSSRTAGIHVNPDACRAISGHANASGAGAI